MICATCQGPLIPAPQKRETGPEPPRMLRMFCATCLAALACSAPWCLLGTSCACSAPSPPFLTGRCPSAPDRDLRPAGRVFHQRLLDTSCACSAPHPPSPPAATDGDLRPVGRVLHQQPARHLLRLLSATPLFPTGRLPFSPQSRLVAGGEGLSHEKKIKAICQIF